MKIDLVEIVDLCFCYLLMHSSDIPLDHDASNFRTISIYLSIVVLVVFKKSTLWIIVEKIYIKSIVET